MFYENHVRVCAVKLQLGYVLSVTGINNQGNVQKFTALTLQHSEKYYTVNNTVKQATTDKQIFY